MGYMEKMGNINHRFHRFFWHGLQKGFLLFLFGFYEFFTVFRRVLTVFLQK